MQNTYISLDIIFLDADLKVITIHQQAKTLQTEETYPSSGPAKYAVELNAGVSDEIELKLGDQLQLD